MTETPFALTPGELGETIHALLDYRLETERYIGRPPDPPCCEHTAARYNELLSQRQQLLERLDRIDGALTFFQLP